MVDRIEGDVAAQWEPIDSLKGWERNPRKHGETVSKLVRAIIHWGWGSPIEARLENREIIAGHGRMQAAQRLPARWAKASAKRRGKWHPEARRVAETGMVPVRLRDLDEDEAHQAALADNRIGQESSWDDELLAEQLEEFEDNLDLMGFEDSEVEKLLEDPVALPAETFEDDGVQDDYDLRCKLGDVWRLSEHTLVCADNRTPGAWPTEKARAVWTDPPYGVGYCGTSSTERAPIANDESDATQLKLQLRALFKLLLEHTVPGAPWYIAGPPGPEEIVFGSELVRIDVLHQVLVWVKHRVFGRSDHHYRHEFVFYGWSPGASHQWIGGRDKDSVFEFDMPHVSREHPTMKPIGLVGEQLSNSTKAGDLVIDPHGGSGTTLIACEQLGLRCWTIELDAGYCSGIIARWEKATGRKAELQSRTD